MQYCGMSDNKEGRTSISDVSTIQHFNDFTHTRTHTHSQYDSEIRTAVPVSTYTRKSRLIVGTLAAIQTGTAVTRVRSQLTVDALVALVALAHVAIPDVMTRGAMVARVRYTLVHLLLARVAQIGVRTCVCKILYVFIV